MMNISGNGNLANNPAKTASRKGQAAMEFYSYIMFFLLVFAVGIWAYFDYVGVATEQKQMQMVEQMAASYAMPIDTAIRFGDGYQGTFRPTHNPMVKINGVFYKAGYTTLNWSSARKPVNYYSYPLLSENVTYTMGSPFSCMNVSNVNGTIIINEYTC